MNSKGNFSSFPTFMCWGLLWDPGFIGLVSLVSSNLDTASVIFVFICSCCIFENVYIWVGRNSLNIFCLQSQDGWGQGGAGLLLLLDVHAQVDPGQTPESPDLTFEACAQETTLPLGRGLLLVWSSLGLWFSRNVPDWGCGACAQRCSVFTHWARCWVQICAGGGWMAERREGSVHSRVFYKSELPEVRKRKMNIIY